MPAASIRVCDRRWRCPRRPQQDVTGSGKSLLGERRTADQVARHERASSVCRLVSAEPVQRARVGARVCSPRPEMHLASGPESAATRRVTWSHCNCSTGVQHKRCLCVQIATQSQSIRSNGRVRRQSATDWPKQQTERIAAPALLGGSRFARDNPQSVAHVGGRIGDDLLAGGDAAANPGRTAVACAQFYGCLAGATAVGDEDRKLC